MSRILALPVAALIEAASPITLVGIIPLFAILPTNSENHSYSFMDVENSDSRIDNYLWDTITTTRVKEFSMEDYIDGFVVANSPDPYTGITISYPKFTTSRGTLASLKEGIFNRQTKSYESDKLKMLICLF